MHIHESEWDVMGGYVVSDFIPGPLILIFVWCVDNSFVYFFHSSQVGACAARCKGVVNGITINIDLRFDTCFLTSRTTLISLSPCLRCDAHECKLKLNGRHGIRESVQSARQVQGLCLSPVNSRISSKENMSPGRVLVPPCI